MRKKLIFSAFSVLCCALFSISVERASAENESASQAISSLEMIKTDLNPDPQLVSGTLSNGLHYYIRPNAEPKGRISVRLRANVGSLNEEEDERGISHFLEHMVFAGSKNFGIDEVIPAIQKKSMMFGRDVNAYTSFEETVYMIDLPNKEDDTVDMSMKLMRDFADGALFDAARLDRERGVIMNELKTRDSADYRVMKQELSFLFDGTNLVHRLPIGVEKVIMETPREKFVDYYNKHYAADQISFIIVGDITPEEGKALVEKYFSTMKPSGVKSHPERGTLNVPSAVRAKIIEEKESPLTNISISNVSPYIEKPDTVENRLQDLPLEIAMSMINRRLEILKKEESCPFLQAGAYSTDVLKVARQTAISGSCKPSEWKAALNVLEQELRRAVQYGFTDDEYEEAKQKLIQGVNQSVETWPTRLSDDIADSLIRSIGSQKVFTSPQEDRRILLPALEKLNAQICSEALVNEWKSDKAQVLLTGTIEIPGGEEELLAAYKASAATLVEAPKVRKVGSFAYDHVGDPGKIEKKEVIEDLDIVQIMLSNGVRVNYKQTDFEKNTITIVACVDGGNITKPVGKTGLHMYAGAIFNSGGLEAHNNDDLERLMAGKTVNIDFSISEDNFIFSGATNREDLGIQLKLICAYLNHPGYHKEADIVFKRNIPSLYERLSRDSMGVFRMNVNAILTGDDYRFAFPTQEQLSQYTIEDVKSWVGTPLKENALEVSIIGDFEPQKLEELLEQTLAALPKRAVEKKTQDAKSLEVKFNPFGGENVLTYPTNLDKSMTSVIWKSFDGKDKQRKLQLNLLNQIFNILLFDEIRDKMSDAYSPRGTFEASDYYKDYGFFSALSPGTSENSERVGKAIRALGDSMAKGNISQDVFERMHKPLLATLEKAQRENNYWLRSALMDSQFRKDKLDLFRSHREDVNKTTLEEMKKLAGEIFSTSNSIEIRVVPEEKKEEGKESIVAE